MDYNPNITLILNNGLDSNLLALTTIMFIKIKWKGKPKYLFVLELSYLSTFSL